MSDRERATKRIKIEEELPATISEEVENKVEETVERATVKLEDSSVEERELDFGAISDSERERFALETQIEFGPPQIALLDIQREQDPVENPEATARNYGNPSQYLPTYTRDERERLATLEATRTRLVHTGPSVGRLDALLEAQAEITSESRRILVLADRVNFLVRCQINEALGLYAARFALECSLNEEGIYPEEIVSTDRNGNDISKNDIVRTTTDSDPDEFCFGRVVQVSGRVVVLHLENQDRFIARLGRDVWIARSGDT